MDVLEDATADLAHPARLADRLDGDGYFFLPGLLPVDRVEEARDGVCRALADAGWVDPAAPLVPIVPGVVPNDPASLKAYAKVQAVEELHRLGHEPVLLDLMERLFAEPIFNHPLRVVRMIFPEQQIYLTTPPHQDFTLNHVTTDVITCWIPLVPCIRPRGGLAILRGSQNEGIHAPDPSMAYALHLVKDPHDPAWATAEFELGDVLIFHGLTVHRATSNRSDEFRLSVDTRYQATADPVFRPVIGPNSSPPLPGWDVLTKDWSTTRWVEAPEGIELVPNPLAHLPLTEQMAIARPGRSRFLRAYDSQEHAHA